MVMAGMGLDAAMMEGVNEQFKQKVGWFAYVVGIKALIPVPVVRLEISIDEGQYTPHRAHRGGQRRQPPGGCPCSPTPPSTTACSTSCSCTPLRVLGWFPLLCRVLTRPRTDETITWKRVDRASVVVRRRTPRQLDGDPSGPAGAAHDLPAAAACSLRAAPLSVV